MYVKRHECEYEEKRQADPPCPRVSGAVVWVRAHVHQSPPVVLRHQLRLRGREQRERPRAVPDARWLKNSLRLKVKTEMKIQMMKMMMTMKDALGARVPRVGVDDGRSKSLESLGGL